MAVVVALTFAAAHERQAFAERMLPKMHVPQAPPMDDAEEAADRTLRVEVGSAQAAKNVCRQCLAFLAHSKNGRVDVSWPGPDGNEQYGRVVAGSTRDADVLAIRLAAAVRAAEQR
ncbi:MAG TPA: hypothetical protein VLH79_03785 [Chthonomonadales bacterium]|nr:hypothetical protein [Chthonomonadales bacterium]